MEYRTSGLTLLETVVGVAVVGVLGGLLLSAVQKSREATSRITCETKNGDIALAMIQSIDVFRKLPENRFDSKNRKVDQWATKCFPFLGITEKLHGMREAQTPSQLICPTSQDPTRLSPISVDLSSATLDKGFAETTDFVANAGVFSSRGLGTDVPPFSQRAGVVPDLFDSHANRKIAEIRGGLSQTLACWEVSGSSVRIRFSISKEIVRDWDNEFSSVVIRNDPAYSEVIRIDEQSTILRYLPSSIGLCRGYIGLFNVSLEPLRDQTPILTKRVFNVSNRYHGPYSLHNRIVNVAFLDGSSRGIDEDCDCLVAMALATACAD